MEARLLAGVLAAFRRIREQAVLEQHYRTVDLTAAVEAHALRLAAATPTDSTGDVLVIPRPLAADWQRQGWVESRVDERCEHRQHDEHQG